MTDWSFLGYGAIGLGAAVLAVLLVGIVVLLDTRRQHGRH